MTYHERSAQDEPEGKKLGGELPWFLEAREHFDVRWKSRETNVLCPSPKKSPDASRSEMDIVFVCDTVQ
jgi:hypothetical protein